MNENDDDDDDDDENIHRQELDEGLAYSDVEHHQRRRPARTRHDAVELFATGSSVSNCTDAIADKNKI